MGNIILAKQAFQNLDYITCQTFEVNKKVQEAIDNKSIYYYDFIYVTDICIKEPLLTFINNDENLKNKLLIFDHHKSEIEEGNNKYNFVNIIVENEKGKTCGTSLFYNYLIQNNLLCPTPVLDELVELTRQHDTWEWKEKFNNNEKARNLYILYEKLGYKNYIKTMTKIVETKSSIELGIEELSLIKEFKNELSIALNKMIQNMIIHNLTIDNTIYLIGFTKGLYKYRNELSEFIIENGNPKNLDMVGIIMEDTPTVSYRKVKNVDTSKVATYFGGKGHKGAASNPQNNEKFQEILKLF
jgi:oligoribonuclease NrnB/cAMP/cGMP phosphodiesterase (DHH superfamily)